MTDTPFQYAKNTDLDNHSYWARRAPDTMADLQGFMGGMYGGPIRTHWLSWFPMKDMLASVNKDEVAFVDVAGGRGHEAQAVYKETGCEGRFVLQDLPEVINGIKDLDSKVERFGHDFMEAQSVKGKTLTRHRSSTETVSGLAAHAYPRIQGRKSISSPTSFTITLTPSVNPSSVVKQKL